VIARRLLIQGRVQGVFFRESLRQEAERLGVTGWVRNRADGDVEALIQGAPKAVETLAAWAHRGPPAARVDQVDIRLDDPLPHLTQLDRKSVV
jgi:acylphosphatase